MYRIVLRLNFPAFRHTYRGGSAETPELSNLPSFKHKVRLNKALHNSLPEICLISVFLAHSTYFFFVFLSPNLATFLMNFNVTVIL